ncbi:MAG TPA: AmmeMemoRadiSam system protein B [Rugosimonospora sp.]|nr:AmmeMemoRadiSam system protein B [Rugosimonospora sp.]
MRVRPPAVAGRFYPADPEELARTVDGLLAAAPPETPAAAYAVPHAGYQYSGPTAARVYACLRDQAYEVRRVLLLGPPHYSRIRGCAVPRAGAWRTPLGEVPVDGDAAGVLTGGGYAVAADEPFAAEHSMEVQLPFLQRCLPPGVPVLPVAVGPSTVEQVVAVLATAGPGTAVLCSTDLSHYQTEADARQQDARTAEAVLELAPDRIGLRDACGVFALRGLLGWARGRGLAARLLGLTTSAAATGDTTRVVGYGAFAFRATGQR